MTNVDVPAGSGQRSSGRTLGEPVVIIDNVQKSFGQNVVLKDVSLTVHKSEVVVICGRSGSGTGLPYPAAADRVDPARNAGGLRPGCILSQAHRGSDGWFAASRTANS